MHDADVSAISLPQAAKQLSLSLRSLLRSIDKGEGPRVFRVGASVRVTRAELLSWIESRQESIKGAV